MWVTPSPMSRLSVLAGGQSVDNSQQVIHTPAPLRRAPVEPQDDGQWDGQSTVAPSNDMPPALSAVGIRARRYLLEPGDGPWYDIIRTLRDSLGDDETYDLLRAIEIRFRTTTKR